MPKPRMTQQQLALSGQGELKKSKYKNWNKVPGTVIPKDHRLIAPKKYDKKTKKAFKIVTDNLIAMGALSEQDLPAMELMFDCLNDYYRFESLIKFIDETSDDSDETFKRRDRLVKRKNEAMRNFYLWTGKFGITPTDRSRLMCEVNETKGEEDPLDIVLGV